MPSAKSNGAGPASRVAPRSAAAAGPASAAGNGRARYQEEKVRVAIIGVGNCASAFVQGVHYYAEADPAEQVPGL
ncbi:MAG: hypothetical protein KGJ43_09975, partial [Acidobacteriota bacterium]|nr:hypothetical protein [Acidobacteriota bacterium]